MPFMKMSITAKGELYCAECNTCGATMYTHEWVNDDHNERRDAMESGKLRCGECQRGKATGFFALGRQYAGCYSAPGYLDCTDWHYSANLRKLVKELR